MIKTIISDVRFFPTCLIVLDVFAAISYARFGFCEWRKIVYWLSAATLTSAVTW